MTQYIYGLHNGDCEIRYIGKTNDPRRRMNDHRGMARKGLTSPVYNWMRKYGPENIEMVIEAELSDDEDIDMHERFYIALYRNFGNLLNLLDGGEGSMHAEETKQKIRAARANQVITEETRAKMSAAHLGNQRRLGSKHSEETRAKMREAAKNRKPISDETRAKMSAALKGKTRSAEHCAKISASKTGRKLSEEHKAKIAAAMRRRKEVLV